jgi:hypothetical protein
MQRMFDEYIRREVIPFIHHQCGGLLAIGTMGASLGAYHAANTLLKHPDAVKIGWALSGVYDMRRFMDGLSDENFYFNNPVDLSAASRPDRVALLNTCELHLATGTGPWERAGDTYHFSHLLSLKGIRHSLDDWGPARAATTGPTGITRCGSTCGGSENRRCGRSRRRRAAQGIDASRVRTSWSRARACPELPSAQQTTRPPDPEPRIVSHASGGRAAQARRSCR